MHDLLGALLEQLRVHVPGPDLVFQVAFSMVSCKNVSHGERD